MEKIRDRIWLWGGDPGLHHIQGSYGYGLPGTNSRMTPREGCAYFGIPNCCRLEVEEKACTVDSQGGPLYFSKPNFHKDYVGDQPAMLPIEQEAMVLDTLDRVVWSVLEAEKHEIGDLYQQVIRIAKQYPNAVGGILDDFFNSPRIEHFTPEIVEDIRRRLCNDVGRKFDLWVVVYTHLLGSSIKAYLDEFDVIALWTWVGKDLYHIDENYAKFIELTPAKRRLAGLYMWNYGEEKPLTKEQMDLQFDKYYQMIRNGQIEGVILCSNCIADLGIEAVEWTRQWIREVGNELI